MVDGIGWRRREVRGETVDWVEEEIAIMDTPVSY